MKIMRTLGSYALQAGARRFGSYVGQKMFGRRQPETGVTAQYDRVTQYSKKSMPRRKKRQWKKFIRKVQAVEQKSLGTKTQVYNSKITISAGGDFQAVGSACLYGYEGSGDTLQTIGNRDIYRICNNDTDTMLSTTAGKNAAKILFRSGVIDLTFRNTGTSPVELDVYEINVKTDNTKTGNFVNSVITAENGTGVVPNIFGNTALGLGARGVTLFDLPNLISQDNLSIYKKRKYFLPVGNTSTLQHRDPRNHYFNPTDLSIEEEDITGSYGLRKMTQMYVFVAKSVVVAGTSEPCSVTIGVTRKYSYTVNQQARAQHVYNPNGP